MKFNIKHINIYISDPVILKKPIGYIIIFVNKTKKKMKYLTENNFDLRKDNILCTNISWQFNNFQFATWPAALELCVVGVWSWEGRLFQSSLTCSVSLCLSVMRKFQIKQIQRLRGAPLTSRFQPQIRACHSYAASKVEGLDFSDYKTVFQFKNTREILRSLLILR